MRKSNPNINHIGAVNRLGVHAGAALLRMTGHPLACDYIKPIFHNREAVTTNSWLITNRCWGKGLGFDNPIFTDQVQRWVLQGMSDRNIEKGKASFYGGLPYQHSCRSSLIPSRVAPQQSPSLFQRDKQN